MSKAHTIITAPTGPSNPFMRESLADTGAVPLAQGSIVYASPDIITRQSVVSDPDSSFATSDAWGSDQGQQVEAGSENYVYLRVKNPTSTATTVYLHLYKSFGSTLNDSTSWIMLSEAGGVELVLPASNSNDGIAVIQTPVPFNISTADKDVHQCLICYITDSTFTPPIAAPPPSVDDYPTYLLNHNTCALRNLVIVDNLSTDSFQQTFSISNTTSSESIRTYYFDTALPIGTTINVTSLTNGVNIAASFTVSANPQTFNTQASVDPSVSSGTFQVSIQFPSVPSTAWHIYIREQRFMDVGAFTMTSDHDTLVQLSMNGLQK